MKAISCESDIDGNYFNIYPNPAKDKLAINVVVTESDNYKVLIYSSDGRLVHDYQSYFQIGSNINEISLSQLSAGFYNVVLINQKGTKISERLVIQK